MHLCSRKLRGELLLGGLLLLLTPMAQAQQAPPAAQPPLTYDHDPVPSPDADTTAKPEANAKTGAAGTITRGAGGLFTLHEDAFEVRLNATVVDGGGHIVDTLSKDAFRIYEDNKLQTTAGFQHEDTPVSLGLLIDSSGSMYDKRDAVNNASLDLVKLSNPLDEAFVVDFSWEAYLDQEFTSDIDKLKQGLSYIKSAGGTGIYDAILASADEMSKHAKHPKQVLVVVSDGEDNASTATLEETIQRVQDLDGPVIYCIGLLFGEDTDKNEARHAQRVLEALAEETGGLAFFPKSVREVDAIAAQVAQDIRTQYTITYHSTKPAELGGYRQIHVLAKQKGFSKLDVRTRTGYYPHVMKADQPAEGKSAESLGNGARKPQ